MQIQKINSGYKNSSNATFKSAAEQKIFSDALNISELKKIIEKFEEQKSNTVIKDYFYDVFLKLYEEFSMLYKITKRGQDFFKFNSGGQEIKISKDTQTKLYYIEKEPFVSEVQKNEMIKYNLNASKIPFFQRTKMLFLKKDGERFSEYLIGTEENLYKDSENFKHVKIFGNIS